jgi:hypothetical protein
MTVGAGVVCIYDLDNNFAEVCLPPTNVFVPFAFLERRCNLHVLVLCALWSVSARVKSAANCECVQIAQPHSQHHHQPRPSSDRTAPRATEPHTQLKKH